MANTEEHPHGKSGRTKWPRSAAASVVSAGVVAVVAVGFAVAAYVPGNARDSVRFGTVGEWVAPGVSALALIVTSVFLFAERDRGQQQLEVMREEVSLLRRDLEIHESAQVERSLADGHQVAVTATQEGDNFTVQINNNSAHPISTVTVRLRLSHEDEPRVGDPSTWTTVAASEPGEVAFVRDEVPPKSIVITAAPFTLSSKGLHVHRVEVSWIDLYQVRLVKARESPTKSWTLTSGQRGLAWTLPTMPATDYRDADQG